MYIYGLSSKRHMKRHCVSLERHRHRWQLLVASLYTLFHLNEINTLSLYKSITYSIPILLHGIKLSNINKQSPLKVLHHPCLMLV